MPSMPTLRNIVNDTPADATDVEFNFNTIETHVANELINRSGAVAMTGALTLPGNPSSALEAAPKQYVDSGLANKAPVTKFVRTTDIALGVSGNQDVVWEAETNDVDGWGAVSSATLTCPADGLYVFSLYTTATGIAGGGGDVRSVQLTGSIKPPFQLSGVNPESAAGSVQYVPAGTQFKLQAFTSSVAGTTCTWTEIRFVICRLAAI